MPSTGAAVRKHRAGFPGGAVSAPYTSLAQLEYTSISFWKPLVLGTSNKSVFLHLVSLKLLKNQANVTSVFLVLRTKNQKRCSIAGKCARGCAVTLKKPEVALHGGSGLLDTESECASPEGLRILLAKVCDLC